MMNDDWLKGLKAGDEVAVSTDGSWGGVRMQLNYVDHITPTGRIVLANKMKFNSNGTEMTSDSWHKSHLYSVDEYRIWKDKQEEKAERQKLVAEIGKYRMETYNVEDLNKILAVLKQAVY